LRTGDSSANSGASDIVIDGIASSANAPSGTAGEVHDHGRCAVGNIW
jgi:hypothetical protein